MKRLLSIAFLALLFSAFTFANEKIVSAEDLPQEARDFITENFSGVNVNFVLQDNDDYEVMLMDGTEVEFDKKGNWEKVKNREKLPTSILPSEAAAYISKVYPGTDIIEIEKNWNKYDVKLANNWELRFDKDGNFQKQEFDD